MIGALLKRSQMRLLKGHKNYVIIIFLVISFQVFGQISPERFNKIDSLFTSWNAPDHPGGSILVSMKGKPVFSKAYGLASLEYKIPNCINTQYNIGSVSKQFTAMGIVIMEAQKKLSYDDDIRKHIPELPDFGKTITIRHLLQHTSGLRDIHGLLALAGWRRNDLKTNDDLYRLLEHQEELNFNPGDEVSYSNTGYILLAKIIENISNVQFDVWMEQNIFEPLGMHDTYVEAQYDRVVNNNATSYYSGEKFYKAIEYWGYYGNGNMHSTTSDLARWLQNFVHPPKNWEGLFASLSTTDPLNNGYNNIFGYGVIVENYLGQKIIYHGGAVGGYRAFIQTYPDQALNIVILTNFSGSDIITKVDEISKILIGHVLKKQDSSDNNDDWPKHDLIQLPVTTLKQFEGVYWSNSEKIGREVYVRNDTLRYANTPTREWPLVPISESSFRMMNTPNSPIVEFHGVSQRMVINTPDNLPSEFKFLQNISQLADSLDQFAGDYYSPELKTSYSIYTSGSDIYIEHARHGKIKLKRLYNDVFAGDWPVNIIEVKRSEKGVIQGLRITNGRTRNVWFKKYANK